MKRIKQLKNKNRHKYIAMLVFVFFASITALNAQYLTWHSLGYYSRENNQNVQAGSVSGEIASTGTPYVAFTTYYGGQFKTYVKKFNGWEWETVGDSIVDITDPSLVLDTLNTPYIFCDDEQTANKSYVKYYNGSNWMNVGSLSFGIGSNSDITIDPDGYLYITYLDATISGKAIVKKFTQSVYSGNLFSGTWQTVGTEGFTEGNTEDMTIKTDDAGVPYIGYYSYENGSNLARVMKYSGGSWVSLGLADNTINWGPTVSFALDNAGVPYVAYADSINEGKISVKKHNGTSWDLVGAAGFTPDTASHISLGFDDFNRLYVAYRDKADISAKLKKFNTTNNAWEDVGSIGNMLWNGNFNDLAFDSIGNPYIFSTANSIANGTAACYMVCENPTTGGTIGSDQTIASGTKPEAFTSISLPSDFSGIPEFQWQKSTTSSTSGYSDIVDATSADYTENANISQTTWYKRKFKVGCESNWVESNVVKVAVAVYNWSFVGTEAFTASEVADCKITIDSTGTPYIAFTDGNASDLLSVMKYSGGQWNYVGTAGGINTNTSNYIDLKVDAAGTPYVAYQDDVSKKANVKKFDGTNWVQVGAADFVQTYDEISLAINSSGNPMVVFQNSSPNAIHYAFNGTSWSAGNPYQLGSWTKYISFALDNTDVYCAYRNTYNDWLEVAKNGTKICESTGIGNNAEHISIAVDGSGTLYVAYSDATWAKVYKYGGLGTTWSQSILAYNGTNNSLETDQSGALWWAYQNSSGKATVKKYTTSWATKGNQFTTGAADYLSLAINPAGDPYVFFRDGANSNKGTVMVYGIVCDQPTDGGTIAAAQTVLSGTTPDSLTSTTDATGGSGNIEYIWQRSTESDTTGFVEIPGSYFAGYQPGALTETTWFKRLARADCASDWNNAVVSNVVEIGITNPFQLVYTLTGGGTIYLPLYGNVDVTVDWGDNSPTEDFSTEGDKSHAYVSAGIYHVKITGSLTSFGRENYSHRQAHLTSVTSFGNIGLDTLAYAFYFAENLSSVPASLPASVKNLSGLFANCTNFNQDISNWDVSNVTDMSIMFGNASAFNQDIGDWNVGNVTNMNSMFRMASSFNQDIGDWNVGNVTDMNYMFLMAPVFNQDIGDWNVGNVTNMNSMFCSAPVFNQDIGDWNTASVTDMSFMFCDAKAFNQDIGGWNTGSVTNMSGLFDWAINFNQDISDWNTANVTDMSYMFDAESVGQNAFDQNLGEWNISAVTTMEAMFNNVTLSTPNYDSTLIGWAAQNVQDSVVFDGGNSQYTCGLAAMARDTLSEAPNSWTITDGGLANDCPMQLVFNTNLSAGTTVTLPLYSSVNVSVNWGDGNTENITTTGNHDHIYAADGIYTVLISGTLTEFGNKNLGYDNTDKLIKVTSLGNIGLESLKGAFYDADNLEMVSSSLPASVTNLSFAFYKMGKDTVAGLNNWDVSNVTNVSNMFREASNFNQDIGSWNISNVTNTSGMFAQATSFNQNIGSWDVGNVTDMSAMFYRATSFNQNIGNWDVANVTNMGGTFSTASSFNQNIGTWDVSNVTSMSQLFYDAEIFNQDIGSWSIDSVTSMNSMFESADAFNQNLNNWNVSNVTDMENMFRATDVFNGNIANWNTGNVNTMAEMFAYTKAFNSDISNWDVSSVTTMEQMFYNAEAFNGDIGNWKTDSVTTMEEMFREAAAFNQGINTKTINQGTPNVYTAWDVSSVTNMSNMFREAALFNQDIGNWDVGDVTEMQYMFHEAPLFNQDIGSWDVDSVTDMTSMFNGASAFNYDLKNWELNSNVSVTEMFDNCGMDCSSYSTTLKGWAEDPNLPTGKTLGATDIIYGTDAAAYRTTLVNSKGWTINGDIAGTSECLCNDPDNGGTIATAQTICYGTAPDSLTSTALPTNYLGELEYKWQLSTQNASTGFNDISNSNAAGYQPGILTATTWLKRIARVDCMADWTTAVESNVVEMTVYNDFTPGAIETIGETICYGGNPVSIGSSTDASGGDETITYKWESSTDNFTTDGTEISGATAASYDPPTGLTVTTSYRRYAKDASCNTTFEESTGTWIVTVIPLPTSDAGQDDIICASEMSYLLDANTANASSLSWATSGTGTFVDDAVEDATYTPSESDKSAGSVELTLTVSPTSPCADQATSTMTLSFQALPTANAGTDDASCGNVPYQLNGTADHAASVSWSGGNGSFSNPATGNPVYTPDLSEYGTDVTFTFTANATAPCAVPESDEVTLTIHEIPTATIEGETALCQGDDLSLNGLCEKVLCETNNVLPTGYGTSNSFMFFNQYFSMVEIAGASQESTGSEYTDYSATVFTELYIDSSYILACEVTNPNAQPHYNYVFIDWNRDGDFDDQDEAQSMGTGTGSVQLSTSITVPATASLGKTLMRVKNTNMEGASSSGAYPLGETEDYMIEVIDQDPAIIVSYNWVGPLNWQSSEQNNTLLDITSNQAGMYQLSVTNTNGCTTSGAVTVNVTDPQVQFPADTIYTMAPETLALVPGNFDSYAWNNGNSAPVLLVDDYGIYTVTVTQNNCTDIASISIFEIQEILLHQGWGMFSTYINTSDSVQKMVKDILPNVVILKDDLGHIYTELFGGIDNIGLHEVGKSYQYKLLSNDGLTVYGSAVEPENQIITLPAGFSSLGYLRKTEGPIAELLSPIVGSIAIVKDEMGKVFWPTLSINMIGDMMPGCGYQIKTTSQVSFSYPSNEVVFAKSNVVRTEPSHFIASGSTGVNMTLGILKDAWSTDIANGDEVGIFSSNGQLVGSGVYTNDNMAISLLGYNDLDDQNQGLKNGETYTIKLWNAQTETISTLEVSEWIEGDGTYTDNATAIVGKLAIATDYDLTLSTFPNPFAGYATIEFSIPQDGDIKIELLNSEGKVIEVVTKDNYTAGTNNLKLDGSTLGAGNYFVKFVSNGQTLTKTIQVLK